MGRSLSCEESSVCRELVFTGDSFPTRLDYPVVLVHIGIPQELVGVVCVHHPVLGVVQPVATVVPPQGDLGGRDVVG